MNSTNMWQLSMCLLKNGAEVFKKICSAHTPTFIILNFTQLPPTKIYFNMRVATFLSIYKTAATNKQLLDEVEHDIMNYQSRGPCYLPQPSASADNTDTRVW